LHGRARVAPQDGAEIAAAHDHGEDDEGQDSEATLEQAAADRDLYARPEATTAAAHAAETAAECSAAAAHAAAILNVAAFVPVHLHDRSPARSRLPYNGRK